MVDNLWNDDEAERFPGDLGLRVYTSRLLGRDKSLVLHGGGNTSVKARERNLFGEEEDILYVKGSGWDLETIEAEGFAPVRLGPAQRLATLPRLSDPEMVNELRTSMTRASAPTPSVEAILHAVLPYKYVDHTHADAVVTVTNTPDGEARVREIWGGSVVIIPYVMPGFDLARLCAERFPAEAGPETVGMVLMNHGIFSFGATARESYDRMIELVRQAEEYLEARGAWALGPFPEVSESPDPFGIAKLRHDLSKAAGFPMVLAIHRDARSLAFARREDVGRVSQQGPATPDHVIRTKRLPLVGRDVEAYVRAYHEYFEHAQASQAKTMLDPAPRVVLDPELGLATAGRTVKDAAITAEIYQHTMDVIERAERLGGWQALSARASVRRGILGPGAGQARQGRQAPGVRGRGGPGHRRGLGDRPRLRRGPPGPRRGGRGAGRGSPDRGPLRPPRFPRPALRRDGGGGRGGGPRRSRHRLRRAGPADPERRHLPRHPQDRGPRHWRSGTA